MTGFDRGALRASSALVWVFLVACGDEIVSGHRGSGGGPSAGGGSSGAGASPSGDAPAAVGCTSVCCPTEPSCYADPSLGLDSPGAECVATQDNTGKDHVQLRQQWIAATTPVGNTINAVYSVLSGRTQLPWMECNQSGALGSGGYIQLIDFFLAGGDANLDEHYSQVGYATSVSADSLAETLETGFCFGETSYTGNPAYALAGSEMSPSDEYPMYLPKPMGLADGPWQVKPARAKRVASDFDVATQREQLLEDIATKYAPEGFNAVFYYDSETGYAHGYAPLSWTVVYRQDGSDFIAIPIREVETKSTLNDPEHPNCVGAYRNETLATCSSTNPNDPPWGCANQGCEGGKSPATTHGYFLISELEQIFADDLNSTLCVSYPTQSQMQAEGFWNPENRSCRTAKWNPALPDGSGLPEGDWCAKTNGPKEGACHDAWRSESYHVYAGAKIRVDETCPF